MRASCPLVVDGCGLLSLPRACYHASDIHVCVPMNVRSDDRDRRGRDRGSSAKHKHAHNHDAPPIDDNDRDVDHNAMSTAWPVEGVLQPGSTARALMVDTANQHWHVGMLVKVLDPQIAYRWYTFRVDAVAAGGKRLKCTFQYAQQFSGDDDENGGGNGGDANANADANGNGNGNDGDGDDIVANVDIDDVELVGSQYRVFSRNAPRDVTAWEVYDLVDAIAVLYTDAKSDGTLEWQRRSLSTHDLPLTAASTISDIEAAWTEQSTWLARIQARALELRVVGDGSDEQLEWFRKLQHVTMVMACTYQSLTAAKYLEMAMQTGGASLGTSYVNPWGYAPNRGVGNTDEAETAEFLLAQAARQHLQKRGDCVYERVKTRVYVWEPQAGRAPRCSERGCTAFARYGLRGGARTHCLAHVDVNSPVIAKIVDLVYDEAGVGDPREGRVIECATRAWRPMLRDNRPTRIADWIDMAISRTYHYEMWVKFVSSYQRNMSNCEGMLKRTRDPAFPHFAPNRYLFSFANGVYDINTNRFTAYGDVDERVPDGVCMNHIPQLFDPLWTRMPASRIIVPGYDAIIESQRYDDATRDWLDAMIGRLFFPINERDKWQKITVIKGWAATGKSTIAKAVSDVIGAANVGVIACNCEDQWPLANIYDKAVWMCLELKSNFRLPTGLLQSMSTGEHVVINKKFETAFDILWTVQGLLVGNETPATWSADVGNALARRVLSFPFDQPPICQDSTVAPRFMANLGRFFARVVRQYTAKAEWTQQIDPRTRAPYKIDDILPQVLKEAVEKFKRDASPVLKCIEDSEQFELAPVEKRDAIIYELVENQHVSSRVLQIPEDVLAEILARHRRVRETTAVVIDYKRELETWSVTMTEFAKQYRAWSEVKMDRKRGGPNVTSPEVYQPAAREKNLAVVAGVIGEGSKPKTMLCWYGIRAAVANVASRFGGGGGGGANNHIQGDYDGAMQY